MLHHAIIIVVAVIFLSALRASSSLAADTLVLFGSHDTAAGKGFSVSHFNTVTGELTSPKHILDEIAPAYFVLTPDARHVYACNETNKFLNQPTGGVSAYALDPTTGQLKLINQKTSIGSGPAYVTIDHTARFCLVANYGSGSVAAYAILADGSLGKQTGFDQHTGKGPVPKRQEGPHAHSVVLDPTNQFALSADLGVDRIYIYRFDAKTGSLTPNDPPFTATKPGDGPRHIAFNPSGTLAYVSNELANTATVYRWDSTKGILTAVQSISTLPADFKSQNTAGEILVHSSGKYLYVSNRGRNSIALFNIDPTSGKLAWVSDYSTQGKTPRNFEIDPTGRWLLATNQDSNTALVFSINPLNGELSPIGSPIPLLGPFCPRFMSPK